MVNEKKLIDANDLKSIIENAPATHSDGSLSLEEISDFIDAATEVDAVEVVHGRWEKVSEKMPIYRCSICKERNLFKNGYNVFSNYCPNCGAKMDGDENV